MRGATPLRNSIECGRDWRQRVRHPTGTCQPAMQLYVIGSSTHCAPDQQWLAVPARREPATQRPVHQVGGLVDATGIAQDAAGIKLVAAPQAGGLAAAVGAACRLAVTALTV